MDHIIFEGQEGPANAKKKNIRNIVRNWLEAL